MRRHSGAPGAYCTTQVDFSAILKFASENCDLGDQIQVRCCQLLTPTVQLRSSLCETSVSFCACAYTALHNAAPPFRFRFPPTNRLTNLHVQVPQWKRQRLHHAKLALDGADHGFLILCRCCPRQQARQSDFALWSSLIDVHAIGSAPFNRGSARRQSWWKHGRR